MRYRVNEIFSSFQGEGTNMGKPCTFIRLQGCNLACPWCDSKNTWKGKAFYEDDLAKVRKEYDTFIELGKGCGVADKHFGEPLTDDQMMRSNCAHSVLGYTWWTLDAIEQECVKASNNLVVITGGEPLLQEIKPLIDAITSNCFEVAIETNGTLSTADIHRKVFVACSPKIPQYFLNADCYVDEIKLVADKNLNVDVVRNIYTAITSNGCGKDTIPIWIQPCDLSDEKENQKSMNHAAEIVKDLRFEIPGIKLGLQAHKYWAVR